MKLPKHVTVGPHRYRIRSTGKSTLLDLQGLMGQTDSRSNEILVSPDQSDGQQADTLLHEILHAAYDQTSLRRLDAEAEEAVVSALTPILLGVLRNNPDIVKVLTGA